VRVRASWDVSTNRVGCVRATARKDWTH